MDQPLAETTVVAPQNLLLRVPESTKFTTGNELIDANFRLSNRNVRSRFSVPNLQSTDSLTLTVDCQVLRSYYH